MRRLKESFPDELVIIGVHSAKFPSEHLTKNIKEAVQRLGIEHPVVNDAGFNIWNEYNVHAWPTIVLIDPNGKIQGTQAGEITAEELRPIIARMVEDFKNKGLLVQTPLEYLGAKKRESEFPLKFPAKVLAAGNDLLYIADTGHHRVLEIQLTSPTSGEPFKGAIRRIFGNGEPNFVDGIIDKASFNHPHGLALMHDKLYVADTGNHAIRSVDLNYGMVRTVAGTGEKAHGNYTLGEPTKVPLRSPWDLYAYEKGKVLFIAMAGSHQIWALIDEQQIGPFAGNGSEALVDGPRQESSFNQPSGITFGMDHLFIADPEASAIRAISLTEDQRVKTIIGQGLFEFGDRDGVGDEVRLQHPEGIAYAGELVYIADSYNNKIKRLDPTTRKVETLIGTGLPGDEDGKFPDAGLYQPEDLSIQKNLLFIADTNNHLIRIADLDKGRLNTLSLEQIEKLPLSEKEEPPLNRLEQVVVAPGSVEIELDFQLPPMYKLNPDTQVSIEIVRNGSGDRYSFDSGMPVRLNLGEGVDSPLIFDILFYYCEVFDVRLCQVYEERVELPFRRSSEGKRVSKVIYRPLVSE